MNVSQLISYLSDLDGDSEVRLAIQPNYPFEHRLAGVRERSTHRDDIEDIERSLAAGGLTEEEKEEATSELLRLQEQDQKIVYLLEGGQICYGSKSLWDED